MPTWAWFILGYLVLAILVSPLITACLHDTSDDDWP